jgi:hypothetical protein
MAIDIITILVVQLFYKPMGNEMLPWPPGPEPDENHHRKGDPHVS